MTITVRAFDEAGRLLSKQKLFLWSQTAFEEVFEGYLRTDHATKVKLLGIVPCQFLYAPIISITSCQTQEVITKGLCTSKTGSTRVLNSDASKYWVLPIQCFIQLLSFVCLSKLVKQLAAFLFVNRPCVWSRRRNFLRDFFLLRIDLHEIIHHVFLVELVCLRTD